MPPPLVGLPRCLALLHLQDMIYRDVVTLFSHRVISGRGVVVPFSLEVLTTKRWRAASSLAPFDSSNSQ
jgi:hypothetical protein